MGKGDDLEDAAAAIERAILSEVNYGPHETSVVTKMIIVVHGVKHEIDVFVTVLRSEPHHYIFECKNWRDAVGKNEVIIFAEKIRVSGASVGFLVAPSFGVYAKAQAKLCPNMRLLNSSEDFDHITSFPDYHFVETFINLDNCSIAFSGSHLTSRSINQVKIRYCGKDISAKQLPKLLIKAVVDEAMLTTPTGKMDDCIHELTADKAIRFPRGQLYIGGQLVEAATVRATFSVKIERPEIRWKYEVGSRGRAIQFVSHFQKAELRVTFANTGTATTLGAEEGGEGKQC